MKTISTQELKELYERDFPLWVEMNLQLLREKAYELVDWENLLEETEDMAQRYLDGCISQLARILEYLYKWDHFRDLAGGETAVKSWIKSVRNARKDILAEFKKYPSIRNKLPAHMNKAWIDAVRRIERWLEDNGYEPEDYPIPEEFPYTYEEAMTIDLRKEL